MSILEDLEHHLAAALPLPAYRILVRREVITLVYHAVTPSPPAHLRHIYPCKTPDQFEADLIYLKREYHPVSYAQVRAQQLGEASLPPRAVLVTFDDGYTECDQFVAPLLAKHRVPAVFFLTSDLLDNQALFYRNQYSLCVAGLKALEGPQIQKVLEAVHQRLGLALPDLPALLHWLRGIKYPDRAALDEMCAILEIDAPGVLQTARPYLTRAQAQNLAAQGHTLGAHGRGHAKLNLLRREAMQAEILESCRAVQSLVAQPEVPFAFPFSGYGIDRQALAGLRNEHPHLGLFFDSHGLRRDRPFVLNRIWTDPPPESGEPASNLETLIHAAYQDAILWRRRYLQNVLLARLTGQTGRHDSEPGEV